MASTLTADEKRALANEAEKSLDHWVVKEVMAEYAGNMGFRLDGGLPAYGLRKVCGAVAVAARCHALGIDPDAMVATEDETAEAVGRLLRGVAEDGVPIMVVVDQEEGTGS